MPSTNLLKIYIPLLIKLYYRSFNFQKIPTTDNSVPNSDFCRIRRFCRIHFAESEYSAEYLALPNNEENMFKNKKRRQKITNYDYRRVIKQFCTSSLK